MAAGHRAAERGAGTARLVARAVGLCVHRDPAVGGMDLATPMGTQMRVFAIWAAFAFLLTASNAVAGDRYALIVSGAAGGDAYAQKYTAWRTALASTLLDKFKYPADRVVVLADSDEEGVRKSTRENVQRALGDFRKRLTKDDQLLVLLIGHGTTADGDEAKFNLVGPALTAGEWADLIRPIPGRVVFVNTTAASFPFLRKMAGRGRSGLPPPRPRSRPLAT